MNTRSAIVAVLTMVGFTSAAAGVSIICDPDQFAPGTLLNNAWAGVTLAAYGAVPNSNVLSASSSYTSTGSNVFTHTGSNQPSWGDGIWEYLQADFAGGAVTVSLDFIADDSSDQNAVLNAYDSGGTLVSTDASVGTYSSGQVVKLTVQAPYIAYITAEGDPIGRSDAWNLDNLVYTPVPEPATLSLLGLGGCLALIRRRRR